MDKEPPTLIECILIDLKNTLMVLESGRIARGVDNIRQIIRELEHEVRQTK